MLTDATFADGVRELLDHLYDSSYLQKHQLATYFVDQAVDPRARSQELRRIFLDAIQAMRPAPQTPAQSPDWRAYRILELRYLEGLTPRQTMEQVALAKSQFYREQARILEMLTTYLWTQYCEQGRVVDGVAGDGSTAKVGDGTTATVGELPAIDSSDRAQLVQAEVARLCAHAVWQPVDLDAVLREVQQVVSAVAATQGVVLQVTTATGLHIPRADAVLLRQAILNVVTYGLDRACGGRLLVTQVRQQNVAGICIHAEPAPQPTSTFAAQPSTLPARQGIGLLISQQLMMAMGGELLTVPFPVAQAREAAQVLSPKSVLAPESWTARLIWSTSRTPVLLVIDDNEELLQLFQRYLVGYAWQVIGVTDGEQARRILEQLRPTVIILDVMMPKEDGWAILQKLKADPTTATIPVVVCSVLNEPQLARSLGAAAYLPKPVKQRALLQALARWGSTPANPPSAHPAAASAAE